MELSYQFNDVVKVITVDENVTFEEINKSISEDLSLDIDKYSINVIDKNNKKYPSYVKLSNSDYILNDIVNIEILTVTEQYISGDLKFPLDDPVSFMDDIAQVDCYKYDNIIPYLCYDVENNPLILQTAIELNWVKLVEYIINIIGFVPKDSLIHCEPYVFNMVKLLVDNGAEVDFKHEDGSTTLLLITNDNDNGDQEKIIKYLVEKGADIDCRDCDNNNVLCVYLDTELFKFLVESGADINCCSRSYDRSVLADAIHSGKLQLVDYLMEREAKVVLDIDSYKKLSKKRCMLKEVANVLDMNIDGIYYSDTIVDVNLFDTRKLKTLHNIDSTELMKFFS